MSAEKDLAAILIRDEGVREKDAEFLAGLMLDRLQWPAEGGPAAVIDNRNGQVREGMTPADLVNEMRRDFRFCFAGGPLPPKQAPAPGAAPTFAPGSLTDKAIAEHQANQAKKAKATDDGPNPWAAGSTNLTRQAIMERDDPTKAARLKVEAAR